MKMISPFCGTSGSSAIVHLVEIENGDFAVTMARQLIFSAYQYELYTALLTSADPMLSALAAKAVKEVDYHRDHADAMGAPAR